MPTFERGETIYHVQEEKYIPANTVKCPRCGYVWQYNGIGKYLTCSQCGWQKEEASHKRDISRLVEKKYLSMGLCLQCFKRPLITKRLCQVCKDKAREVNKRYRQNNVKNGLCIGGCKLEISPKSTLFCEVCLEKCRVRSANNYARNRAEKLATI